MFLEIQIWKVLMVVTCLVRSVKVHLVGLATCKYHEKEKMLSLSYAYIFIIKNHCTAVFLSFLPWWFFFLQFAVKFGSVFGSIIH